MLRCTSISSEVAEQAAARSASAHRHHHRREAELEIDRRLQPPCRGRCRGSRAPAPGRRPSASGSGPRRRRAASGRMAVIALRRHGDVVDGAGAVVCDGRRDVVVDVRQAVVGGQRRGPRRDRHRSRRPPSARPWHRRAGGRRGRCRRRRRCTIGLGFAGAGQSCARSPVMSVMSAAPSARHSRMCSQYITVLPCWFFVSQTSTTRPWPGALWIVVLARRS